MRNSDDVRELSWCNYCGDCLATYAAAYRHLREMHLDVWEADEALQAEVLEG